MTLPPGAVPITQYGQMIFDTLHSDREDDKFHMFVDDEAGFRQLIPNSTGNEHAILRYDIAGGNKDRVLSSPPTLL
jgi:hypothetical protein